jgi:hypothetical protein
MRHLFIIDPLERLHPDSDSSIAFMREAGRRGHVVETCLIDDLGQRGDVPFAHTAVTRTGNATPRWYETEDARRVELSTFDAIWMRKDPPFDMDYLFATLLLSRVKGPVMVNDPQALRDGTIDLEIGKRGDDAPELHTRMLFHDWHVAVARTGHPLFASARITPARYAACHHVIASQLGDFVGPAGDATGRAGPGHAVHVVVPGYPDAMRVAASTDLIALVPRSSLGNAFSPGLTEALGLRSFESPVHLPAILVSALWHPRMHGDPVHRRLRDAVIAVCQRAYPDSRAPHATARRAGPRTAG